MEGGLSERRGMRRSLEGGWGGVDEELEVLVRSGFCFLVESSA